MPGPPFNALTIKFNGRASQLITDLNVSSVYDLSSPPNPLPAHVPTKALWDTGASKSVISQDLVKQLGLTAVGATNVNHAGGMSMSPTYLVHFHLTNGVKMAGVLVTEFPAQPHFSVIIGMDVITFGDLSITNLGNKTWMSFRTPSIVAIDYVSQANKAMFAGTPRNAPCPCASGKKFKQCHGQ